MDGLLGAGRLQQRLARRVHHDLGGQSVAILPIPVEQRKAHGDLLVGGNRVQRARPNPATSRASRSESPPCAAASCRACARISSALDGGMERTDSGGGRQIHFAQEDRAIALNVGALRDSPSLRPDLAATIRSTCCPSYAPWLRSCRDSLSARRPATGGRAHNSNQRDQQRFSLSVARRCWPLRIVAICFW